MRLRYKDIDDPQVKAYLGDIMYAPTFHRQDMGDKYGIKPAPPRQLSGYVQMMADIHHVFRHDMPNRVDIRLDTERLDEETRTLLQRLPKIIASYRGAVKALQERTGKITFTGEELLALPDIAGAELKASGFADALLDSTLAKPTTMIPLLVAGQPVAVRNTNKIGLATFALQESKDPMLDISKVPPSIGKLLKGINGTAVEIPQKLRVAFSGDVLTINQFNAAYKSLFDALVPAIRKGAQQLQVLNLVQDREYMGQHKAVCPMLLGYAELPEYPERLETPQEAALVLHTALRKVTYTVRDAAPALQYANVLEIAHTPHMVQAMDRMAAHKAGDLYARQMDLLKAFVANPPSFVDKIASAIGPRQL